eukprot:767704-Hanusia_phi.AAC.3
MIRPQRLELRQTQLQPPPLPLRQLACLLICSAQGKGNFASAATAARQASQSCKESGLLPHTSPALHL